MFLSIAGSNPSLSDQINSIATAIEEDLTDLKKEGVKKTTAELQQELIQYILAQIAISTQGDNRSGQAKTIGEQIDKTIQGYTSDIQKADHLATLVKGIENDPKDQTAATLNSLTALLALVQKDVQTGGMSNLPSGP